MATSIRDSSSYISFSTSGMVDKKSSQSHVSTGNSHDATNASHKYQIFNPLTSRRLPKKLLRAPQAAVRVTVKNNAQNEQKIPCTKLQDETKVINQGYLTIKDNEVFSLCRNDMSPPMQNDLPASRNEVLVLSKNEKLWFEFFQSTKGYGMMVRRKPQDEIVCKVLPLKIVSVTHLRDKSNSFFLRFEGSSILWLEATSQEALQTWVKIIVRMIKNGKKGSVFHCGSSGATQDGQEDSDTSSLSNMPSKNRLRARLPSFRSMSNGFKTEDDLTDIDLAALTPKTQRKVQHTINADATSRTSKWYCLGAIFGKCFQRKDLKSECLRIQERKCNEGNYHQDNDISQSQLKFHNSSEGKAASLQKVNVAEKALSEFENDL